MDLKTILLTHGRKYPLMEPRDAVKLIYQNEFGGGHLIRDQESCLNYLRQEYDTVPQQASCDLYEPIGNGLVRVNLAALEHHRISLSHLGAAFLDTAEHTRGSLDAFCEKLAVLTALADAEQLPFSPQALAAYLEHYRQAGFPIVSHSEAYRSAYHPAYRVVRHDILRRHIKQML